MATLSLCMVVKNEEKNLPQCLHSIKQVIDELIIVDTGSNDATKEIAKCFGAKVYEMPWEDNFAKVRNGAFEKASKDYILWLDADDYLNREAQKKMYHLKRCLLEEPDIILMPYGMEDAKGEIYNSFLRERLIRRKSNLRWEEPVHEAIPLRGSISYENVTIRHRYNPISHTKRNLRIYEKWIEQGNVMSIRSMFYCARDLYSDGQYEKAKKYLYDLQVEKVTDQEALQIYFLMAECEKKLGENELHTLYKCLQYTKGSKVLYGALIEALERRGDSTLANIFKEQCQSNNE